MTTKIQNTSTQSVKLAKPAVLSKPDASATAELNKLAAQNPGKGSISGEEMAKAILAGTKDADGQAAGKEFDAVKKFVQKHGDKLSPEAKKVFDVYSREAMKARATGQTGIDFRNYNAMQRQMLAVAKPQYKDASASKALNELAAGNTKKGSISGKEMMDAILKGTKDLDGASSTREFQDISKFARENAHLLSPEAKKVFDVYAKAAQSAGKGGIAMPAYNRMARDMMRAATPNYQDLSAGKQLEALAANNKEPGSISGKEMMDAIVKGTRDLDGKAATSEFRDIAKFVRENEQLLSPEAKATFAVYEKTVQGAKNGQIGLRDFMKMQGEMAKVAGPKYGDASMASQLNALAANNKEPGSISGRELTQALLNGARDYDGQAAGAEFRDAAKFVKENGHLLSPEAKQAFAVYQKYAAAAQAKGEAGIAPQDFARMSLEMQRAGAPRYGDQSAAQALNALAAGNTTPGSISGREMEQAIISGTRDLDNQAAGKEYADLAKFVKENGHLLSPQAKATFAVYEKYAKAAQAKGQTGIPLGEYSKMQMEMSSLNRAYVLADTPEAVFGSLVQGPPPTPPQIGAALQNGLDSIQNTFGQLGSLFPGVPGFGGAQEQLQRLGAELAKEFFGALGEGLVKALNDAAVKLGGAPANEKDPLNLADALAEFKKGVEDLFKEGVKPPPLGIPKPYLPPIIFTPRPDAGATAAVNELLKNNTKPGSISGKEMTEAIIKGTADLDNQAAGTEFAAFQKLVKENPKLLSPEAKKAFEVYEKHARAAQAKGQTGIPMGDYLHMQREMRAVSGPLYQDASAASQLQALAKQNTKPGSISGKEMVDAIIQGTVDKDNQAAGKEYADIAKFVRENEQLLSPEAKKAFSVYESHVKSAQARGQTGIDLRDFARMEQQLQFVGQPRYQDASAASSLNALAAGNKAPGSISGNEMADAISRATRDLDNQAAGKEFADISKFVKENEQLLSPEAKRAFGVYEKYAKAAQAKGQTGISTFDSVRMNAEMRQVGSPQYQDASAAKALNALAAGNKQPGSISGQEMSNAIFNGIKDLDGKAATTEFRDIAKFVKENEQLLSPEAKRVFQTYENTVKKDPSLSLGDLFKLKANMDKVGQPSFQDSSAGAAIKDLAAKNRAPGSISPNEMRDAILRGTRDLDSQAAGKEFADFAKFVKENEQLLSPGAKKVFAAYEKAAKAAQAKGQTGIDPGAYQKMSREMLMLTFFPQR
ncbi:MAG: hypothetical protein MUC96_29450 [Myxococcaceae bacterium]|jgi:hypothetical protein|nr:hypothetical protein [Myxococcaceae bacterium]